MTAESAVMPPASRELMTGTAPVVKVRSAEDEARAWLFADVVL